MRVQREKLRLNTAKCNFHAQIASTPLPERVFASEDNDAMPTRHGMRGLHPDNLGNDPRSSTFPRSFKSIKRHANGKEGRQITEGSAKHVSLDKDLNSRTTERQLYKIDRRADEEWRTRCTAA